MDERGKFVFQKTFSKAVAVFDFFPYNKEQEQHKGAENTMNDKENILAEMKEEELCKANKESRKLAEEDLEQVSGGTTAAQALQGKIAGVNVTTASGQPGAASRIRIRGTGSINASDDPLYVID